MSGHPGSRRPRESGSHPDAPARHCARGHRRGFNTLRALAQIVARRVRSRLPPPPPRRPDARTPGSLGRNPEFFHGFQALSAVGRRGGQGGETRPGRGGAPVRASVSRACFRGPGSGAALRAARSLRKADIGSVLSAAQCCRPPRLGVTPARVGIPLIPGFKTSDRGQPPWGWATRLGASTGRRWSVVTGDKDKRGQGRESHNTGAEGSIHNSSSYNMVRGGATVGQLDRIGNVAERRREERTRLVYAS